MGFVAEESPSSLRHSVLHLWASIMDRSVTQACRAAPSSDKKARNCCSSVPCCTPGRRKVWVSLPKSPFILTSFSPTPTGNKNGLKCRLNVSYCTLGQRKWAEVLPESVVLHSRATNSVGFVAEESHSSLRHSALHLWASIMDRSVTQACRAALSGDENVRKCCLSVPRYTLGRRKVWVSLPKSPLHPYVILPYTHGQQKWTEVSPERVVLYPRATKMRDSVAQACRAALSGDEKYGFRCRRVPFILTSFCPTPTGNKNGRKCCLKVSCCTLGRRKWTEVSPKRAVLHSRATKMDGSVA